MSISRIIKPGPHRGFSLIELLVVVIILVLLAGTMVYNGALEKERNARINLKLAFQAEKDAFAYSAPDERYASSWSKLLCGDLNTKDRYFTYTLEVPTRYEFIVKAASKNNPARFFTIDQDGALKDNRGVVYK
ncbi:MAG TPA: prepilin-type N-terminal cleavage/methylation domain-containing protein [Candidatus Omnitrophota bacterium]|nr:prepilin-type N-terminal cleavage/methylation domain-containing protein [Candidatus Omnitrophota bacterium]HNQ50360.1 prepilin-type N-terminal cleavage/methylation domain-containing protein [Candidatus Omnitrophota bacterium]HQO38510.1 prepilin-type N-terminal cleavage/methylation domain-containing protein [Candidatus Omnitrophota bacterium]